jgi:sugar phosphate isomerase/epimerase
MNVNVKNTIFPLLLGSPKAKRGFKINMKLAVTGTLAAADKAPINIKKFKSDYFNIHIDTYHMNIEESDCREAILKAKGKIGHCHIADSDRWYAGHGHFDFKQVLEALKEINYDRALSVESFMFPNSTESAKKSSETIRAILNALEKKK